jgi:hypothetical protein
MVGSAGFQACGQVHSAQAAQVPRPAVSDTNRHRCRQVEAALAELLAIGLVPGFFGTAMLTLAFHDGNIQCVTKHLDQKIVR